MNYNTTFKHINETYFMDIIGLKPKQMEEAIILFLIELSKEDEYFSLYKNWIIFNCVIYSDDGIECKFNFLYPYTNQKLHIKRFIYEINKFSNQTFIEISSIQFN